MTTSTQTAGQADSTQALPPITIYNTLSRKKEPLEPVEPGKVGIYLCGPTVYDKAHIGHMVGPVIFDCIKRYLVYCGFEVTWVVNITDVDDKLINKANERGISMLEVAEENIEDYRFNLNALGVDSIDHFPRATECMEDIIQFIERLVEREHAYVSGGDVYFDVGRDADYGKLSNRSIDSMQGEGGATAQMKRSAADFALWKSAKSGEPSWESSWGPGRPGWHIECSAMSHKLLGETFDIHGGGLDLVFPHHENEIAQSECCHDRPMVKYWAHNGLLRQGAASGKIGGRGEREETGEEAAVSGKMSRSKGAGGLADLIGRQGGERIRFFLLRTHYRSTVLFNEPAIEEAGQGLDTFYRLMKRYQRISGRDFYALDAPSHRQAGAIDTDEETLKQVAKCRDAFLAAMDDDFNTGGAVAQLFELASLANRFADQQKLEEAGQSNTVAVERFEQILVTIRELGGVLGVFRQPVATGGGDELTDKVMQLVIQLRAQARANKNFGVADAIRDGLSAAGVTLEDRAGGTEWSSGAGDDTLEQIMQLVIRLRADARQNKDFGMADAIRDGLTEVGITLEDRASGTEWSAS